MRNVPFDVEPLSGALGAVLHGVDLARLDDELFAAIEKAWLKYLVVFFVDQELTPEQQIAFARRLGDIHYHPYMQGLDEHPEILEIVKEPVRHIPSDRVALRPDVQSATREGHHAVRQGDAFGRRRHVVCQYVFSLRNAV